MHAKTKLFLLIQLAIAGLVAVDMWQDRFILAEPSLPDPFGQALFSAIVILYAWIPGLVCWFVAKKLTPADSEWAPYWVITFFSCWLSVIAWLVSIIHGVSKPDRAYTILPEFILWFSLIPIVVCFCYQRVHSWYRRRLIADSPNTSKEASR